MNKLIDVRRQIWSHAGTDVSKQIMSSMNETRISAALVVAGTDSVEKFVGVWRWKKRKHIKRRHYQEILLRV